MVELSCLCEKTKLTVKSFPNEMGACHCLMCRTWGGGPFLTVEIKDGISFSSKENVKTFNSSEWAERGFCSQCGTHLFYRLKGKDHYYLPAGLFVFNYNGMWLDLFISTDILKYSVIASLLIGFAFPNVLPKLLGAIWNFLYKNLNWWAD